jgi:hypothetical protein
MLREKGKESIIKGIEYREENKLDIENKITVVKVPLIILLISCYIMVFILQFLISLFFKNKSYCHLIFNLY